MIQNDNLDAHFVNYKAICMFIRTMIFLTRKSVIKA